MWATWMWGAVVIIIESEHFLFFLGHGTRFHECGEQCARTTRTHISTHSPNVKLIHTHWQQLQQWLKTFRTKFNKIRTTSTATECVLMFLSPLAVEHICQKNSLHQINSLLHSTFGTRRERNDVVACGVWVWGFASVWLKGDTEGLKALWCCVSWNCIWFHHRLLSVFFYWATSRSMIGCCRCLPLLPWLPNNGVNGNLIYLIFLCTKAYSSSTRTTKNARARAFITNAMRSGRDRFHSNLIYQSKWTWHLAPIGCLSHLYWLD